MDHETQQGSSSQIPPRRTKQTTSPPQKDSMRDVGVVAAILFGLVLVIGGIWMYQEQAEEPPTATRAVGKNINREAKTVMAPKRVSRSQSPRALRASADRPSPVPSSGEFDVYFKVGQDSLTAEAKALLAKKAPRISAHKKVGVLIHGHTDPRGSAAFNQVLGRKRARAVEAELVKLGVPKTAIQVFSQGEQGSRCRSKTKVCYRKNRRVHISWSTTPKLTSASAGTQPASEPAQAEKRAVADAPTGGDGPKEKHVRAAQAAPK